MAPGACRYDQGSTLGSYLDPLADKVFVGAVVGSLGYSVRKLGGSLAEAGRMRASPLRCAQNSFQHINQWPLDALFLFGSPPPRPS